LANYFRVVLGKKIKRGYVFFVFLSIKEFTKVLSGYMRRNYDNSSNDTFNGLLFFCHFSTRYFNCVNGTAYELRCRQGLIFDESKGDCLKPQAISEVIRKKCENP
jgi:hypothetical protein